MLFKIAIKVYLNEGYTEEFEHKLQDVHKMESDADHLRRAIETKLYAQTLIPDSRGDVLGLIENLDQLLTCMKARCGLSPSKSRTFRRISKTISKS